MSGDAEPSQETDLVLTPSDILGVVMSQKSDAVALFDERPAAAMATATA
jgi:hypothetical protein